VEEEGIKSALELAMERISALPQLTPEEIEEQKQKENAPIGTAIAVKYINGALSVDDLPVELSRYEECRQPIIRRALLSCLCSEMRIENNLQDASRALRGMAALAPRKKSLCEQTEAAFERIFEEFETEKEQRINEFRDLARQKLRDRGICGSAVRPNLDEDGQWNEQMVSMQQAYAPKLGRLRNNLLEELLQG
jgi:hypothetical protein